MFKIKKELNSVLGKLKKADFSMVSKPLTMRFVDNFGAFLANISTVFAKFFCDIPTADFNYGNRFVGKCFNEDNPTVFSGIIHYFSRKKTNLSVKLD